MVRSRSRQKGLCTRRSIRRVVVLVSLVGILVALLPVSHSLVPPPPTTARSPRPWAGRCVSVSDGDTISVRHRGSEVRVRLNAVDCPEGGQAFGNVARHFTSDLVFRKVVTVRPTDTDRYGRTVGDVLTPEGRSLNEALVEAGLAWWYRRYAPDDRRLRALEAEARDARRGLWRDANPIPPWEFRRMRR